MGPIYLDTSVLYKLVVREPETDAARRFLAGFPERVTSVVGKVELLRGLLRLPPGGPRAIQIADAVLRSCLLVPLDDPVLARAAALPPPALRSLDALHLATALAIPQCAGMVTYDRRLSAAAAHHGLAVWSPGLRDAG